MTTKTKQARKTTRKPRDANGDGRSNPDAKVVLVKGATAQRGLMARMVKLVSQRKRTRDEIAKACKGQPRSRVMKNVAWGIRHGVFGIVL